MRVIIAVIMLVTLSACGSANDGFCAGKADGTACDDHDVCTQTAACQKQKCVGADPITCDFTPDALCYATPTCDPNLGCPQKLGPCSTSLQAPLPLLGCPNSDYFGSITVGDQNVALIMDSGSTTLAVAGANCTACTGISPTYVPSATAVNLQQNTSTVYGDGNGWNADVYSDVVSSSAMASNVTVSIAVMTDQFGFFTSESCGSHQSANYVQGIMGLGGPSLAAPHTDSYLANMAATAHVPQAFSMALCDFSGQLWFGGYDPASISEPVKFTPVIDASFYGVALHDVQLGGVSLGFSTAAYGTALVDTGTSGLLFPNAIANAMANVLLANKNFLAAFDQAFFEDPNCAVAKNGATRAELDAQLPTFTMVFPAADGNTTFGVELSASASYMFANTDGTSTTYCSLLSNTGTTLGGSVLGNAVMRTQVLVFDGDSRQVGFAPQKSGTCP